MRRRDRRIKYVVLGVFAAVVSLTFLLGRLRSNDADAASLANFDPGFIISDYTMSNYNSMTQAEIQSFLTRKNPCSNSDYDYYLSLTANNPGVYWHWKDGHFVCISEELFGEGTTIGEGKTAAQIIYETAQEYRINPQVLLVLIQKESSLITDPIPNNYDYRAMTGFGCPDTAPCDSKYYGFKNQIRKAAWLFREVLDGGWTNYPVGENYIQYNPNSGCGGSIVNVKNLATSALYRYTPYQPNAGAIAAGYGTAYCGAYGNRNFYLYFEDWFGGITNQTSPSLGRTIPEGVYQITIGGKALDIRGGITEGMTSGELIAFQAKELSDETVVNQTFTVKYNDGYYNIYNESSGLYMTYDSGEAIVSTKTNGCSQKWILKLKDTGVYEIITSCNVSKLANSGDRDLSFNNGANGNWKFFEISGETNKLQEGEYRIISQMSSGIAMEIRGDVDESTQNGQIKTWNKKDFNQNLRNQIFKVKYNSNTGYYTITNKITNLAIDVRGNGTADGTEIIAWPQNYGCNQQWMLRQDEDGYYSMISACTGKVLDARGGQPIPGKEVLLWTDHAGTNQRWKFEDINEDAPLSDGTYIISPKTEQDFAIDIYGGITEGMTSGRAIIFTKKETDNDNQQFKITRDSESGLYTIQNPASSLYMSAEFDNLNQQNRVLFATRDSKTCKQQWRINRSQLGFYSIKSACLDASLDIYSGEIQNGKNIILFSPHGKENQQWVFIKQ